MTSSTAASLHTDVTKFAAKLLTAVFTTASKNVIREAVENAPKHPHSKKPVLVENTISKC